MPGKEVTSGLQSFTLIAAFPLLSYLFLLTLLQIGLYFSVTSAFLPLDNLSRSLYMSSGYPFSMNSIEER